MTKMGKEILDRLRRLAKNYSCIRWDSAGENYIESDRSKNELLLNSTMLFLDKFEEVEKLLNLGGFIQDTNNILCKHGDKVLYVAKGCGATEKGYLRWSPGEGAFLIDPDEVGEGYYLWELSEWYKEADIG